MREPANTAPAPPSRSMPRPDARPCHETILGRYRVMATSGTGGFGTVLTCWDTRLQRRVAIKRMPLATADGSPPSRQIIDEALAEARTSSLLAHPNIVTVYDFEVDRDWAYLVMEYVDGPTLTELLARVEGGTLTNDEVAFLVESVGGAVALAHENGVLHLDIKPSNIMFERTGTIKICDFGMATLASATGYGGARGGTVGYMPPEQLEGGMVDERTDVFALAVVCWQALLGENPFLAPTAQESLTRMERGPRKSIDRMDPEIKGMAAEAIMQGVDPSPAGRPPSIEAFSHEVAFGLGDAGAGAASIRHLLEQYANDGEVHDNGEVRKRLPLSFRYPWLEGAVARGLAALTCAILALETTRILLAGSGTAQAVTCVLAAGASAAWPPLASVLAIGGVCAAVFATSDSVASIMMGGTVLVLLVTWWAYAGRATQLTSTALLLPVCTGTPALAPFVAAFSETPGHAMLVSLVSWLLAQLTRDLMATGFVATAMLPLLAGQVLSPTGLASLASTAAGAGLGSLITRRGSVGAGMAAQILCLVLVPGRLLVSALVENGGLWGAESWVSLGLGVLLCVFLCIATAARGPMYPDEEAGQSDEAA